MADPERGIQVDRLERFLFAPVDPLAAAVFRIALAAMVTVVFWPLPGWYWPAILGLLILFGAGLWPRTVGLTLVVLLLPAVFVVAGRQPGRRAAPVLTGRCGSSSSSSLLPNFLVDLSAGVLHVGGWQFPVWLGAVGTVLTEAALAVGFWFSRLRVATALLGVLFHITLMQIVRIGLLDVVSLFLCTAFLLPFDRGQQPRIGGPS